MGKHRDEIWQELCDLDNRVTRLEDRAILKPEYDPSVDGLADLRAENARLVAERDALRARIDGGTVVYNVYGADGNGWTTTKHQDNRYAARLIDIAPIADAGDVDERKGAADRKAGSNE